MPWNRTSFLDYVRKNHPEKREMHEQLLNGLEKCTSVAAAFDARGTVWATYKIRLRSQPATQLAWVYPDGAVYIRWKELGNQFGSVYRDQLRDLFDVIKPSNDDGSNMRNHEGKSSQSAVIRVAQHLPQLDEFASSLEYLNPDEQAPSTTFAEGARKTITVNSYERDRRARDECIKHYGDACAACKMSFMDRYGVLEGFIHVHHLKEVSASKGKEYIIDPKIDLIPLCPNCHAVAHARPELYSVEDIRNLLYSHSHRIDE